MTPMPGRRAGALDIDIQIASPLWQAQPLAAATVRAAIAAASAALGKAGEVSVLLTDDAAIRALNREWRGIDQPTNVLSFPAAKGAKGASGALLGDIVVAYETLARECEEEAQIFLHHLAHLAVHGFLHLIGYDHRTDSEAEKMERLESKIMRTLQMPDPWHARDLERS